MNRKCERCSTDFMCNVENVEQCGCKTVLLTTDTIDFLKESHFDCLCNQCLNDLINRVTNALDGPTFSTEGIHYTLENGLLVFTELNHIQRGYCCKSDCRHCPYGYHLIKE